MHRKNLLYAPLWHKDLLLHSDYPLNLGPRVEDCAAQQDQDLNREINWISIENKAGAAWQQLAWLTIIPGNCVQFAFLFELSWKYFSHSISLI